MTTTMDAIETLYRDRNLAVALLARMCASNRWPAVTAPSFLPVSPGFSRVVTILTPEGQVSWHYPDSMEEFFSELPRVEEFPEGELRPVWDGHDAPEKLARMERLIKKVDEITRQLEQIHNGGGHGQRG